MKHSQITARSRSDHGQITVRSQSDISCYQPLKHSAQKMAQPNSGVAAQQSAEHRANDTGARNLTLDLYDLTNLRALPLHLFLYCFYCASSTSFLLLRFFYFASWILTDLPTNLVAKDLRSLSLSAPNSAEAYLIYHQSSSVALSRQPTTRPRSASARLIAISAHWSN